MGEMTLAQREEFTESGRFAALPSETMFVYCDFADLEISRPSVGGVVLGCSFTRIDWYWELFNAALLSRTAFDDCVFRGCSFRNVDFLDCTFTRCRFELDNLGGGCLFDDCRFVGCVFENCEFVPAPRDRGKPLFARCRFYECSQSGGRGEQPPFS